MSKSLTFSASYQTGNSSSQSATCSLLSNMQYNCTAEFAVDIIPSVGRIESVNVTVSGPYSSASTMDNKNQSQLVLFIRVETGLSQSTYGSLFLPSCRLPDQTKNEVNPVYYFKTCLHVHIISECSKGD